MTSPAPDHERSSGIVTAVLNFARAMAESRSKVKMKVGDEAWHKWFDELPVQNPNIRVGRGDDDFVLQVTTPLLPSFPLPGERLGKWLKGNPKSVRWDEKSGVMETMTLNADTADAEDLKDISERSGPAERYADRYILCEFSDDPDREDALRKWRQGKVEELPGILSGWVRPGDGRTAVARYVPEGELTAADRRLFGRRRKSPPDYTAAGLWQNDPGSRPLILPALAFTESFNSSARRKEEYRSWLKKRAEWLAALRFRNEAVALHTELRTLKDSLDASNLQDELVVGNFILVSPRKKAGDDLDEEIQEQPDANYAGRGRTADDQVEYPLLVQRLQFDLPSASTIRLAADPGSLLSIQSKVIATLGSSPKYRIDSRAVPALDESYSTVVDYGAGLISGEAFRESFRDFAARLEAGCHWTDGDPQMMFERGAKLVIHPRAVLILRKRTTGIPEAIGRMADYFLEHPESVPHPFERMVCETVDPSWGVDFAPAETAGDRILGSAGFSDDILLTKPANEDQLKIVRQVNRAGCVLVQGPPGTGKTHTIANLMGHFLAQGNRILVTSTKAAALSVLKGMLPEDMQSLCISYIDSAEENYRNVSEFTGKADDAAQNLGSLRQQSARIGDDRRRTLSELRETNEKILASLSSDRKAFTVGGRNLTLCEVAVRLGELEGCRGVLPGMVNVNDQPFSLTKDELVALYEGRAIWNADHRRLLSAELPPRETLPGPAQVRDWFDLEKKIERDIEEDSARNDVKIGSGHRPGSEQETVRLECSKTGAVLEFPLKNAAMVSAAWQQLDAGLMTSPSPMQRYAAIAGMEGDAKPDRKLLLDALDAVDQAAEAERHALLALNGIEISPEEVLDDPGFQDALGWIKSRGGKLSWFERLFNGGRLETLGRVRVNGEPPLSKEAIAAVEELTRARSAAAAARKLWNLRAAACGDRLFDEYGTSCTGLAEYCSNWIRPAIGWQEERYSPFRQGLLRAGAVASLLAGQRRPRESAADYFDRTISGLRSGVEPFMAIAESIARLVEIREQRDAPCRLWRQYERMHPAVSGILKAMNTSPEEYEKALAGFDSMNSPENRKSFARWNDILARLDGPCPGWAAALRSETGPGKNYSLDELQKCWEWHQLDDIYRNNYTEDLQVLLNRSRSLERLLHEQTRDLATKKAWIEVAASVQKNQQSIYQLRDAAYSFRKYGKGTGKNAQKYLRDAADALAKGRSAVPAWIMTIDQALASFHPGRANRFDVLIVDESSQADLVSLALLGLADKAIIVGDDRQVTPLVPGVSQDLIGQFQDQYLSGRLSRYSHYTLDESLYAMAGRRYTPFVLREHFRCVPAIIGFSNRLCYGGSILPLRPASDTPVQPPFVTVQVDGRKNGTINEAEADKIVCLMLSCFQEKEYEGKTFGVVTMRSGESGAQADLIRRKLIENITPKEFEARKIRVGIPPDFQGDERDVIFLSLIDTADTGDGTVQRINPENDVQKKRYNVAVSRARDQVWVVHSFDWQKQTRTDDLRRKLFEHIANIGTEKEIEEETRLAADPKSTAFEAPVAKALRMRNYRIRQQFPAGAYRIDIVVTGADGRSIALECDGDRWHSLEEDVARDVERQKVLERCGWRFIRLRGSEYFRNPEAAIDRVCRDLEAAGITPSERPGNSQETHSDLKDRVLRRAEKIAEKLLEKKASDMEDAQVPSMPAPWRDTGTASRNPNVSQDPVAPPASGHDAETSGTDGGTTSPKPTTAAGTAKPKTTTAAGTAKPKPAAARRRKTRAADPGPPGKTLSALSVEELVRQAGFSFRHGPEH